jgi:hypothetical protein
MLGCTVKPIGLTVAPSGFCTAIRPLVAPWGTTAFSWLLETGWNFAEVPLNETEVVDFKAVPVIVTVAPTGPWAGLSPLIVGEAACATLGAAATTSATPRRATVLRIGLNAT